VNNPTFTHKKFKKALVIVPPFRDFYFTKHRFSALGAQIAANLLARYGLQVELLNFPLMNSRGSRIDLPGEMNYLQPFVIENETGPLSFFTSFRRFGPTPEACVAMIEEHKPEICFFSVFAFCYADDAIALAKKIRAKMPSVPLVAGGGGPAAYPGYFIKDGAFNYVFTGEAEACIAPFFTALALPCPDFKKVPNLVWKKNGAIQFSPLLTRPQDKELEIVLAKTSESGSRITFSTSLTRGCPKLCDFCSSRQIFGNRLRTVSLGRIEELLANFSQKNNQSDKMVTINFEDDNLLCNEHYFRSAVSLFRKFIPGVTFIAENGIDYSLLTPELCEWLVQNGMSKFNLSLASFDAMTLKKKSRFIDLDRYEKVIAFLAEKNIPSVTYFICGFKEDTLETTADNLSYLFNKQTVIGISMFYAVPGLPGFSDTALFDKTPASRCLGSAAFPWNDSLSTETMMTAFRLSRYSNLTKSNDKSETDHRLIEIVANRKRLHTLVKEKSGAEKIIPVPRQDHELVKLFFKKLSP
jgi:anaerobic magnesium-protoporphyrin IX monomethyl ester cyclase